MSPPGQKQDYPSPVPAPLRVLRISWDAETKLEHPEDHTTRGTQGESGAFLDAANVVAVCVNHHGAQAQILPISQSFVVERTSQHL